MHTLNKLVACILLTQSLSTTAQTAKKNDYSSSIGAWQIHREEELAKFASPLSLVGMFWLKPGENTFGSGQDNDIVIPAADLPASTGSYTVKGDSILLHLTAPNAVTSKGRTAIAKSDIPTLDSLKFTSSSQSIVLSHNGLLWFVTLNSGNLAVRVLDGNSEAHRHFSHLQRYPVDEKWRLKGRYEPFAPKTTIAITNVLGVTDQRAAAGIVKFSYDGKDYALQALDKEDKLFFTFSDQTGNQDSYAFRFLTVSKPGPDGIVELDFNKAINPNCAFSKYSPCPLPPAGNTLDFAITAGEKKYHSDK